MSGYVTEAFVIEQAEKAGFKLAARSEINANPEGHQGSSVRRLDVAADAALDALWRRYERYPQFDHSKYVAIGESPTA